MIRPIARWTLALLLTLTAACRGTSTGVLDRFDALLRLQPDGSLQVEEHLAVRVPAGASFRYRRALDRVDRIEEIAAGIDGRAAAEGGEPGQVRIRRGHGVDVEWQMPDAPGDRRDLVVRYRAFGTVAVRGVHATFLWTLLPPDRRAPVQAARATLTVPETAVFYQEPWTEEDVGSLTRDRNTITFAWIDAAPEATARLVVPFGVDARAFEEPRWQFNAERAVDLLPAFVSAGLFILVVGAGVLVMIRVQYPPGSQDAAARASLARGLRAAGLVTTIFGVLMVPVVQWTLGHFGIWPQSLSIGTLVSGIAFLIAARQRRKS